MRSVAWVVWVSTGVAWAAVAAVRLGDPAYRDPTGLLDWAAVLSFSAALAMTAPSVVLLAGGLASTRHLRVVGAVVAVASLAAAGANLIEDGMNVAAFGPVYLVASLAGWIGLLGLAAVLDRAGRRDLAIVPLCAFIGFSFVAVGGAFLTAAAWLGLAVWTRGDPATHR